MDLRHPLPRQGQFYIWLSHQTGRGDAVGAYARAAMQNVIYPRTSQLQILLRYEPDATRAILKTAHRQWRRFHHAEVVARHAAREAAL